RGRPGWRRSVPLVRPDETEGEWRGAGRAVHADQRAEVARSFRCTVGGVIGVEQDLGVPDAVASFLALVAVPCPVHADAQETPFGGARLRQQLEQLERGALARPELERVDGRPPRVREAVSV